MGIHLIAYLKSLPYVKTRQILNQKSKLLKEIKKAVDEMNEIKAGKKTARDARDFLNEL